MKPIYHIEIQSEKDVALVREAATFLAEDMGFDTIAKGEIVLAISEIAHNAWRHGGGGFAKLYALNKNRVLRVEIVDEGEGIPNLEMAMRSGFSTIRTSLGVGLEAAQRLMDYFDVNAESGTQVILEKYLPFSIDEVEYGVICIPDEGYNFNGDDYFIKEFGGDKVLLGVIDGAGQGYNAYALTTLVKAFILKNYAMPLDSLISSCDHLLRACEIDGGVVLSLALLEDGFLNYIGIGDTHAYIVNQQILQLKNLEGRLGEYQLPSLTIQKHPISRPTQIVLCTDGISQGIVDVDLDVAHSAQHNTKLIFNERHKAHGDIAILTIKIK